MQAIRLSLLAILMILLMTACNSTAPSNDSVATEEPTSELEESETIALDTPESRGQALFVQTITEIGFACASCHYLTEARLIGPGLGNLTTRIETYDLELTAEEYVLESIIHPQDFIVEGSPEYPANVMPMTYSDVFTEEQLDDLIAYILSL